MSIKLIATDLDGTLLNEKGEVSALTRKVFLRAQQEVIRIVLATGRDLPYFSQAREALHTDMFAQNFYIALNGARIADLKSGQEQRTHSLQIVFATPSSLFAGACSGICSSTEGKALLMA